MILVIICGHISSLLAFLSAGVPVDAILFVPYSRLLLRDSFFSYRLFPPVISVFHGRGQDGWGAPSAFVTTSPCFPIKNNRRAFFLTVAREIIRSRSFLSKHFCRRPISTEEEKKKRRLREAMFLYFFLPRPIHLLSIISRCSVLLKKEEGNLPHCQSLRIKS